jgi:hypothetical protein
MVFAGSVPAFPCSIPGFPPSRFDITQYLLVGEVTGYVETKDFTNRRQNPSGVAAYGELADKTAGIVVRVKGTFYAPGDARPTYEVYRFSLGADCGLYGLPLEWMKERYKLGDWVTVVAGRSEHIAEATEPAVGRLEVRYGKSDWINTIGKDDPNRQSITSEFDYKAHRSDLIGNPDFEVLKDLRRLNLAGQNERIDIFDRLTYFPRRGFWLAEVFKAYSSDLDEFERYSKLTQAREMSDEQFNRYQESLRTKTGFH